MGWRSGVVVDQDRGRLAYEAYCSAVGGVAWNGDELPDWEHLASDKVRAGWVTAAIAVAHDVLDQRAHEREED